MNNFSRPGKKTEGKFGSFKGRSGIVSCLGLVFFSGLFIFSFNREAAAALAFQQANDADGMVSMEAEHYESYRPASGHEWILFTAAGFSGNCALQAHPQMNVTRDRVYEMGVTRDRSYAKGSPRLDFKINFARTGTHYIWGRGMAAVSGRGSFHAGLDGQAVSTSDRIGYFAATWNWSKTTLDARAPATINVITPGEHTLNVWMREDGFILDKVLVTTNPKYIPTGLGPPENLRTDGAVSNTAPVAYAGPDQTISLPVDIADLQGAFSDDLLPNPPASVSLAWIFLSGPASASFSNAGSLASTATFSQPGVYSLGLLANDGALSRQDVLTIRVESTRINLPGRLEAENYLPGGWGVGYYDATAGNSGGAWRKDDVDIKATSDAGGGYNVGWISVNEWLAYDVNVTETGTYDVVARVACGDAKGTRALELEMDGLPLTGLMSFPVTGGWDNWVDVKAPGINVPSGSHRVRILLKTGSFDLNYIDFNLETPPAKPAVDLFASPTKLSQITLSGSKEANTSVHINGAASVPLDRETTWSAVVALDLEGENIFSLTAKNEFNLESDAEIVKVVRDTVPPAVAFTSPPARSKVNQPQTWVNGTVDGVTFSMLAELEEGENVVTRTETDAAGNAATAGLPLVLDTIPPAIRVISPAHNAWVRTAAVNVEIEFDDRRESELMRLDQEGANQITISRTDEAGNTGTVTHILRLDSVPPEIIFLSHGEGQKVVSSEETIIYTIDGTEHAELFPLSQEGANVFEVNAEDDAGNRAQKTLTLIRDTAAPVFSVDFPLNNAWVNKEEVISR